MSVAVDIFFLDIFHDVRMVYVVTIVVFALQCFQILRLILIGSLQSYEQHLSAAVGAGEHHVDAGGLDFLGFCHGLSFGF